VDLWVFVFGWTANRFYPQAQGSELGPATKVTETEFTAEAQLGRGPWQDVSECFDIIVIAASGEASQGISEVMKEWNDKGEWPGLTYADLPQGVEEKDFVTVQRQSGFR
jgi:hypothetical protein